MSQKNDETIAHQAADVVDNVADGIRSAAHTMREVAGRAVGTVEETCQEAGQCVRDSVKQGRQRICSWENGLEDHVRANPKTSLLLAAVLGWCIASWWNRK